jgi:polyisoprenyl-teichoic acid--peptidoglycan teichoic acid transferase
MSSISASGSSSPPLPPTSGGLPSASELSEPPRRPWWMAKRVLLAAIGIFLLTGGATYVVAVNEVAKVVDALGQSKAVAVAPKVLLATTQGAPETLLLVGNDQRPPPKNNPFGSVLPHSNEMLLVRIDPSKPTISMLSIPRELQVTFTAPNGEVITNRINSAFTYGGAELMLKTIKHLFGISVNHVFVVTFPKFKRAVDEMGCVYMTVDRRYYHVNEPGGEQYFEINLEPGYQRLCGKEALEFVANRHEDTSLTRDARDQRFLLEVKAQYGATLFESREKFERILGRAVETDLHGTGQVLDLLELLVQSQGKPVRQVPFHVNLLPTFDTATPRQREEAAQSFLQGTAAISKQKLNAAVHAARPRTHSHAAAPPGLSLTPTTGEALEKARSEAPNLPFPLEYPKARLAYATASPDTLHLYDIRDQQRHLHPIYVAVVDRGGLGEYYDVQGTNWSDPPLLSNPSQTVQIGSRSYGLFYAGEEIRVISWHEDGGTYWIENTLTDSIQPREMLAMAEQTVPVIGTGGTHLSPSPSSLGNLKLPPRELDATSLTSKLAAGVSLVGLALLALLAFLAISRQRELITLRDQVTHAMALKARQRPLLATGPGAGPPQTEPRGPTIYRSPRRLRRGLLAAAGGAAAVALLATLTVLLYPELVPSPKPVASAPPVPVPVAVYNATSTAGEAHRIAAELRDDRVHLQRIGNIQADLPTGVFVFYPPGAEAQARDVAGKIPNLSPLLRPLPAQIEGAVGQHQEIVVIFH